MINLAADKWVEGASPSDSALEVAAHTLRGRLEAVMHFLPLAADCPNLENVHQLRVWSRRASAALSLYKELLPRKKLRWLKKRLRKIRRAGNDARDCDVLIKRLQERQPTRGAERWLAMVQTERKKAQKQIDKVRDRLCGDDSFSKRVEIILDAIRYEGGANGEACPSFGAWAQACLAPFVAAFFDAAPEDEADEEALHQFRISGKKLRYVMEALQAAFPEEFRTKLYPAIQNIQDRLGEINDLAMARTRLQERISSTKKAQRAAVWRQLLAGEEAQLEQARQDFWSWCTPETLRELRQRFDRYLTGSNRAPDGPFSSTLVRGAGRAKLA
jgi:CHAD domain-containing protein